MINTTEVSGEAILSTKMQKNRLASGALPRTLLRELTVLPLSPQTSCLVGRELTAPSPITLTPPRPFGLCRSLPPPICCKIRLWCQGSCISHETHFHLTHAFPPAKIILSRTFFSVKLCIVLYSSFLQIWIILYNNQGDHLSGNVREFDSCQGFY